MKCDGSIGSTTHFGPGDHLSILILRISNLTKFSHWQVITWREHANARKSKSDRSVMWDARTDGCVRDEKQVYRIDIPVPATPSTDDAVSKICSIEYVLKVRMKTHNKHNTNPSIHHINV